MEDQPVPVTTKIGFAASVVAGLLSCGFAFLYSLIKQNIADHSENAISIGTAWFKSILPFTLAWPVIMLCTYFLVRTGCEKRRDVVLSILINAGWIFAFFLSLLTIIAWEISWVTVIVGPLK